MLTPAGNLAYSAAPAVSYSNIATPTIHAAPALSYATPALHVAALPYSAQTLQAPALSYAAPYHHHIAAPLPYAAPIVKTVIAEPEAPTQYDFGYAVNDPHTGDSKSQQESRRGDVVQGRYKKFDYKIILKRVLSSNR